jgi:aspartyl-tRNA(Asn)/glutamyl-tRNA(Gln) amidotransferase subunit B
VKASLLPTRVILEAEGFLVVRDTGAIEAWVDQAIGENPEAAADVREGGKKQKKAFGFLMGQVMQKSKGAAQPAQVQQLLQKKFGLEKG